MGLEQRIAFYNKVEQHRQRPLIVYVTGSRQNVQAQIASDVISELVAQLQALPANSKELDLFLVSNGGDGTVAWRIVSLVRERVKKFSVLVTQAAFSAATLVALGADEIVMHPYGNLGPTDPQITGGTKNIQFGSEDLAAFLKFAREEVGLTDQGPLLELFKKFGEEVGFVGIGVAARSAQLTASMAEKLLRLHMTSDHQMQKAKVISEQLNTKFFHHGYPVSRTEAKVIELPIAERDEKLESLMWSIWLDIEEDLQLRTPFSPIQVLRDNPACAPLFEAANPGAAVTVPPAEFEVTMALMESLRHATKSFLKGAITGMRLPDLKVQLSQLNYNAGWTTVPMPQVVVETEASTKDKEKDKEVDKTKSKVKKK